MGKGIYFIAMYKILGPLLRKLPAEWAHALGLAGLRFPWRWNRPVEDPFTWRGLTFRNRVGIAAGFDKNAVALPGLERLGIGFVEIGTVLTDSWEGNPDRPRLRRLPSQLAIWNKLGFPSTGMEVVASRLQRFPREKRRGMVVGCNIGPHPGHLKAAGTPEAILCLAREELTRLVERLHAESDFFVVNLSSPNTPGLRGMLRDQRLAQEVLQPLKARLVDLDQACQRKWVTPLLLKWPPEDGDRQPWNSGDVESILAPILAASAVDGFVAVNTSTRLAQELMGQESGGLSGRPLLPLAVEFLRLFKPLVPPGLLLLGCGGVTRPEDAWALREAGADLVEMYSGMIYEGPHLPAACARRMAERPPGSAELR